MMSQVYELGSSSDPTELEEGEIIQSADIELVCVNQEDLKIIEAEEYEQSTTHTHGALHKKKCEDVLNYQVVSSSDQLDELRSKNASEDASIDPKEKLHLVKYVKIDGKIMKLWECGICTKDFRHQYTLLRHLPTHTDERKFVCDYCNKAFRQMSTLSQHRTIHSNARPYVCEVCQKTFNRVSTLISHRRTHLDERPHKCEICGKGFHQKGNLKNHIFSHGNERPYRCEVCGRGFNQMSNLMVHKSKSHGHASEVPTSLKTTTNKEKFSCRVCGEKFQKRAHLYSHEEDEHQLVRSSSKPSSGRKNRTGSAASEVFAVEILDVSADSTTLESSAHTAPQSKTSSAVLESKHEDESTAGLLIDAIQTASMQDARNNNQTAFALLKSIDGTPSLVKIFDLPNKKQLLIPATSDDLTKSTLGEVADKSDQVKVAVVATVTQHIDSATGQLVVVIESLELDQKVLMDSLGSSGQIEAAAYQMHHLDGGLEFVAEEDTVSFLEIVEDDGSQSGAADEPQIIYTSQDELGHFMVEEGTPGLQFLLGPGTSNQQQLQFAVDSSKLK